MSAIGELTTDRPLSNEDRKTLWEDRQQEITSPTVVQGQPGGVKFALQVCRDALGYVLFTAGLFAFLAVMASHVGVL